MSHTIIEIIVPFVLLIGFLAWVALEERTGKRILAGKRYELDTKLDRAAFIAEHVDWGAFVNDFLRTSSERALHDIAHGTLLAVRALERELTRLVRALRARRDTPLTLRPQHIPRLTQAREYVLRIVQRSRKATPESTPASDVSEE